MCTFKKKGNRTKTTKLAEMCTFFEFLWDFCSNSKLCVHIKKKRIQHHSRDLQHSAVNKWNNFSLEIYINKKKQEEEEIQNHTEIDI